MTFGYTTTKCVHNMFIACCILHNMLIDYDEWDDWESFPIIDEDDVDRHEDAPLENRAQ